MSRPLPLVRLPPYATIHRFGTPSQTPRSSALLRFSERGWEISRDTAKPPGWAVVGDADGRRLAVETLLSRHRIHPITPPPGPFPYITSLLTPSSSSSPSSSSVSPSRPVRHLAFARPPTTGEFTDFTARYGALQEEDKLSFRQTLSALQPTPTAQDIDNVTRIMAIDHLLDLPSVSLSSGQTRRARIAAALLTRPVLLLLEDPMAGLDVRSREEVSHVLGELNREGVIRIVLVLRGKGGQGMPGWVTDICEVREGDVWIGNVEEWKSRVKQEELGRVEEVATTSKVELDGEPLVELRDVSVLYGEGTRPARSAHRMQLKLTTSGVEQRFMDDPTWRTMASARRKRYARARSDCTDAISLGSGKTTLLSLILGHHPRSFSLPATSLTLFSRPRRTTPTPRLRMLIGHTSPEIYASFPRGMGLTAAEAVGSGFEGVFSRRSLSAGQRERVLTLLEFFVPHLGSARPGQSGIKDVKGIANRLFAQFTPPQQALLLFLRAIINRPPLVILDEPSQGMDEAIWARCRALLEKEWQENPGQAVVVVSHYEDEVPWRKGRGKVMTLVHGVGSIK